MSDETLAEQIVELLAKSMDLLHQDFITLRNEMMVHKIDIEAMKIGLQSLKSDRENTSKLFRAVVVSLVTALGSLAVAFVNLFTKHP